ncbi:HNH endonuclease [Burkholderia vietnamiensis]|uniref:HNH endonuclease n=1 Tax=Burkholderia vietnamiensis TaxID=60552 RepID=UPI0026560DD2|nr:HNH endonuclease signature motif containing protein [Burkholderia vietnamiensis]MDN7925247.1 HNH endonuclease signature motif containing protein [Burkholderia vietnamiensis]
MAFADVNDPAAVLAAVREYDRVGRDAFLKKYGFGKARDYFLAVDGKRYDSKAIFGAAHGYQFPEDGPLTWRDFSGGEKTVELKLEAMGFRIERLTANRQDDAMNAEMLDAQNEAQEAGVFDPHSIEDARRKTLASIVRRQGQPAFRSNLLRAYDNRCAISGCDVLEVLEAAHIVPYQGPETNHISNGLLLRTDLHTLFDLGLLAIAPGTGTVVIAATLRSTEYGALHGKKLRLPSVFKDRPSKDALALHYEKSGLTP